jgi:hypothetical protein
MSAEDTDEIVRIINLYAFAVDTQRWDLFDRIFTPDTEADYGPTMHWRDLASFKRDFAAFHGPLDGTQHTIANHQIIVDGDRANSMTYGIWRLMRHVPQGGGDVWLGGGWYDDAFVRTAQGWRIKKRVCRVAWWEGNPRVGDTLPGTHFEQNAISMRREAEAGKITYIKALTRKS